ncbi:Ig-like domain-containing protein [Agromyces sp. NPDC055658]
MRLAIPRRHRSAIVTAAAVTAVVAVVATIAVTSGGYAAQRVELGDAAVWVANERLQSVGRASTAALELNSMVETGGGSTIVQRGATVLVFDPDRSSVGVVDAADSTLTDTVPVPPDASTIALAGDQVVIAADGELWTTPIDDFADFEESADSDLNFGPGAVISAAPSGLLFAYTPSTGDLAEVSAADGDQIAADWSLEPFPTDHEVQLTSVGGRWAVFDADDRVLELDGRRVELADEIGASAAPRLQVPADEGHEVWIAHRGGLVAVDLDSGAVRSAVTDLDGTPAAPVVHSGCVYAAWAGGSAWRSCDDGDRPVELGAASDELAFAENGRAIVLNDRANGRTWVADRGFERIDDWQRLMKTERDDREVERNDPDRDPEIEKRRTPPVTEDDEFGARPGRTTVLPVLLNDYDANGDVLAIAGVDAELPEWARLDVISDDQQLQLTLDADAAGTVRFDYSADDGHGGSSRASVAVVVRAAEENAPPVQRRSIRADVGVGERVSTAVLGDWVDPDGDPMFLRRAEVAEPDQVSSTAEGTVGFIERGGTGDGRTVSLVVSDGRDETVGTLEVDVHPAGAVPLEAEPFIALATAGREIVIDPLRHVRGGGGRVELSAVPAKPDVTITPDYDGGTFRFTSDEIGTHYLEYTVTDGATPATGFVRVEVQAPPDRDTTPVTVPHTAFVRVGQPADIDVLATDIDPTGGVLVVTDAERSRPGDGFRVEVVDHRLLRVTLIAPLETGSTVFGYRVSNGLAEAAGQVTLVEIPEPEAAQPPVAAPDTISMRTGDVIDIPVLENDEQPDGLPFELVPDLVEEPDAGLLFASGERLRYFAPEVAGDYRARYRIESGGQVADAVVAISVREAEPETNTPPVPETVTARVIAGEKVRIPVPLSGVDPDGDSVQLLGQQSNPERGVVEATGPDWLDYRAGVYASGTEEFAYSVVDALGARAEGTVRVGIAPRVDRPAAPIAVEDLVTVRPDRTVTVQVLDNDSDPGGGDLRVIRVTRNRGDATARTVEEGRIEVDVPPGSGKSSFIYTIENEALGQATAFLTVVADPDAPLARPEASDTVLGLTDIVGEESVVVPVLENVFLADGDVDGVGVDLVDGYRRGAQVLRDGSIRVEIEDRRRVVPFVVSHPEDPSLVAYAFIRVPGRDDALPQLRADAPDVEVASGESVELELADFVIAASGKPVHITDEASVLASHSDGTSLVVDRDTLRFRSEQGYSGPASISFTVTDGDGPDDPTARTGTIVIPIEVRANDDEPPAITGTVIDFEPGQTKQIDLRRLTSPPAATASADLSYRVLPPQAEGFDVRLDGDELTVAARADTPIGARSAVVVDVADASGSGSGGRIELRVVPSTKPVASPIDDRAIAARGRTTTIDVLANDEETNPFPETPLRVVAVDLEGIGDGIEITPSADRSTLTVTAAADAPPVNTTVRYQVEDATGEASRRAWGSVTVSVQDRPDPVVAPTVTGFGDGTLDVAFGAGGFNNSPITGYEIALTDPGTGDALATTMCQATTCTVDTPGNGRGNAVDVRIRARNGIGFSDPQVAPGPVWSDVIPAPPGGLTALPLDGRLGIEWDPVATGSGSPVHSYVVTVAGVATEVAAASACTPSECRVDSQALANGSRVPVSVSARNEAYPALAVWTAASTAGTPFGPPVAGSIDVAGDAAAGAVTVTWSPFAANGDALAGYFVQRLVDGATGVPSGAQSCQVTSPAPGSVVPPSSGGSVAETVRVGPEASSLRFSGTAAESTRYSFVVWGYNRAGCAHTAVAGTVVRPGPGGVDGVDSEMAWNGPEVWDRYIDDVDVAASRIEIVGVDEQGTQIAGTKREFRGSGWLRELLSERFDFGETGRFQVRGCTVWGSCGRWSDILPAGESPTLTFALPSRQWDSRRSTWSWTDAPDNSGLPVEFSCGVDGDARGRPAQTPTSCEIVGAGPGDTVWLDVRIAGVSARYEAKNEEKQ